MIRLGCWGILSRYHMGSIGNREGVEKLEASLEGTLALNPKP